MRTLTSSLLVVSTSMIVLGGCSQLSFLNKPAATPPSSVAQEGEQLAAAMQSGQPMNCTITNATKGESMTFVTKDKKMKVNGMVAENVNQQTSMINDGQYMYIWTNGETKGIKTKVPTEQDIEAMKEKVADSNNQLPDFSNAETQKEYQDKGYAINCNPGTVADSEFIPPTTVEFQDMSVMMDAALKAAGANAQDANNPENKAMIEAIMKQQGQQ